MTVISVCSYYLGSIEGKYILITRPDETLDIFIPSETKLLFSNEEYAELFIRDFL